MAPTSPAEMVEDGLATIAEAVEFTRLSRSDLYARMTRGELAFVKLGRRRLIPRRTLVGLAVSHLVIPAGDERDGRGELPASPPTATASSFRSAGT